MFLDEHEPPPPPPMASATPGPGTLPCPRCGRPVGWRPGTRCYIIALCDRCSNLLLSDRGESLADAQRPARPQCEARDLGPPPELPSDRARRLPDAPEGHARLGELPAGSYFACPCCGRPAVVRGHGGSDPRGGPQYVLSECDTGRAQRRPNEIVRPIPKPDEEPCATSPINRSLLPPHR